MSNAGFWAIATVAGEYSPHRDAGVNLNSSLRRTPTPLGRSCSAMQLYRGYHPTGSTRRLAEMFELGQNAYLVLK